jgi:peptidoglycan/LPS O-acetylase OafA/YrhL
MTVENDRQASMTQSHDKLPILDGLRAVSILLVLACHLLPLGPKAFQFNVSAGAMGMSLFFALSGFLITSGLLRRPDLLEFITRRLARILPLAFAYTMIVFLIFSFDSNALIFTNLFVVNYLTQYLNSWNEHFWSLCVEMHFYLAIALVILFAGRKGIWVVWPACLAVTLLRIKAGTYLSIETHLRVDEILSGACVATIFKGSVKYRAAPVTLAAAVLLWAISSYAYSSGFQYFRPYATGLLLLASLHYGAVNPKTILASRPMRYIAEISYALYIIHPATAHGWMSEGSTISKYLLKRPISFALTFVLAHLSTFYWERYWQSAAKRWLERRAPLDRSGLSAIAPVAPQE